MTKNIEACIAYRDHDDCAGHGRDVAATARAELAALTERISDLERSRAIETSDLVHARLCGLNSAELQELILFAKSYGWEHPHRSKAGHDEERTDRDA